MITASLSIRDIPASAALLNAVRGRFIASGTSLNQWCIANKIDRVWASDALVGKRNGPKALALRERLISVAERL